MRWVDLHDCIKSESTRHQSILSSISAWLGHWRLNYTFCKIIYMCYKIFKWQKWYPQFRFTIFFWISFLAKANAKFHIYTLRCTPVTNWNATSRKYSTYTHRPKLGELGPLITPHYWRTEGNQQENNYSLVHEKASIYIDLTFKKNKKSVIHPFLHV